MTYTHHGNRNRVWTLDELRALAPSIDWDEPVAVARIFDDNAEPRFACRICIAERGFKAEHIQELPTSADVVREHIRAEHA